MIAAIQLGFTLGVSYLFAYLGAFFADMRNLVPILLRALFFASPVFYFARDTEGRQGIVAPEYLELYYLNPLARFLDCYRDAVLWGHAPSLLGVAQLAAISIGTLILGFAVFSRAERRYAKTV